MKLFVFSILCVFNFLSSAHAIEYKELEVYGYRTASVRELEIENSTSASSNDRQEILSRTLRSSFEFVYGVTDRLEIAAYLDYLRPPDEKFEYTSFRAHARTHFYEKGELPVDLGAYLEVELPKNTAEKDMAFELKPILEKDFSRWTISLNPQIELEHQIDEKDSNATSKTWLWVFGMSSSLSYRLNDRFKPHLDLFQGFTDQDALLMPAFDIVLADHLKFTFGLGFGLNDRTERRITNARLEYEVYF